MVENKQLSHLQAYFSHLISRESHSHVLVQQSSENRCLVCTSTETAIHRNSVRRWPSFNCFPREYDTGKTAACGSCVFTHSTYCTKIVQRCADHCLGPAQALPATADSAIKKKREQAPALQMELFTGVSIAEGGQESGKLA